MMLVYSFIGFDVKWDGILCIYVIVQFQFCDMICGLCGIFNGKQKDEFIIKESVIEISVIVFGNLWKVSLVCNDMQLLRYFCEVQIQRKVIVGKLCNRLLQFLFSSCYYIVDLFSGYIVSCMYDVCGC